MKRKQHDALLGVVDAGEVIDRMKEAMQCHTDVLLAANLGLSAETIPTWRKRGSVPYVEAVRVSLIRPVSVDWLLTGRADPCAGLAAAPLLPPGVQPDMLKGHPAFARISSELVRRYGADPECLAAWLCEDNAMHPTVAVGEMVLLDTRFRDIEADGLYLVSIHGRLSLRRVMAQAGDEYRLGVDNALYESALVPSRLIVCMGRPFAVLRGIV
jgi:hypothetical protein